MSYQQVSEKEPIKNDNDQEQNDIDQSQSSEQDTKQSASCCKNNKLKPDSGPCDGDISCWAKGIWWLSCCNAWFDYPELQPTCYCCGKGSHGNMDGNISMICCPCAMCVGMCGAGIVRYICLCQGEESVMS